MVTRNINLRSILETNKLNKPNFHHWLKTLIIILRFKKLSYVVERGIPKGPTTKETFEEVNAHDLHKDDNEQATCIMLASITSKLQKKYENMDAHTIIHHLQDLYTEISR